MNKQELIATVSEGAGISRLQAGKAVGAVLGGIVESLRKGEEVRLVGFGAFEIIKRKATKGRNPRTGEEIDIPASQRPKFKPGKALRDAVLEPVGKAGPKKPQAKAVKAGGKGGKSDQSKTRR